METTLLVAECEPTFAFEVHSKVVVRASRILNLLMLGPDLTITLWDESASPECKGRQRLSPRRRPLHFLLFGGLYTQARQFRPRYGVWCRWYLLILRFSTGVGSSHVFAYSYFVSSSLTDSITMTTFPFVSLQRTH